MKSRNSNAVSLAVCLNAHCPQYYIHHETMNRGYLKDLDKALGICSCGHAVLAGGTYVDEGVLVSIREWTLDSSGKVVKRIPKK